MATLQDVMVSDTWMIRPTMINVARVSINRISAEADRDERPRPARPRLPDHAEQPDRGRPAVHRRHRLLHRRATRSSRSRPASTTCSRVADDLTWIAGRHSMKFGVEVRRDRIELAFINRPNGDFTFSGRSTPATPPPTSCSASRSSTGRRPAIRTWTATSWVYARLRAGRVPRLAALTSELRPALRA